MQRTHLLVALLAAAAVAGVVFGIVEGDHDARPQAAPTRSGVRAARAVIEETAAPTRLTTRPVTGLGRVLVNGDGRTLYAFLPDARRSVTCLQACNAYWLPVRLAPGQHAAGTAGGVKASLLGSIRAAGGGRVVTYGGWPLYTFAQDVHAGLARGQRALLPEPCSFLNLDCSRTYGGGVSYTLSTSGALNRRRAVGDALGP